MTNVALFRIVKCFNYTYHIPTELFMNAVCPSAIYMQQRLVKLPISPTSIVKICVK